MKKIVTAALVVLGFVSFSSNAEFIHTDWKNSGDKMATLDTETGIEWLKTERTIGMSFRQIDEALNGELLGWRWATTDEIASLFARNLTYLDEYFIKAHVKVNGSSDEFFSETLDFSSFIEGPQQYASGSAYFKIRDDNSSGGFLFSLYYNWRYDSYQAQFYSNEVTYETEDIGGTFLVSDGGTTLSSQLDPTININNPSAPINQVPVPFFVGGLALFFLGIRHRKIC